MIQMNTGLPILIIQKGIVTDKIVVKSENLPEEFNKHDFFILNVSYDKEINSLVYIETIKKNPKVIYPFVPSLEERIKILNLHVPMAWVSVIAFLIGMIYSVRFLKTKDFDFDDKAVVSAALGTLFAILATVTGMLWAKYNWGSYWNWDPRQTSILILILIYAAYFALRSAIDNEESKARLSSVYSIIAFVTVPFLIFILPRMSGGLHPGSAEDVNAGPVISQQQSALDSVMVYSFGLSLLAFTLIFFWMLNIHIRYRYLKRKSLTNK
jgi:heme exporter protein C